MRKTSLVIVLAITLILTGTPALAGQAGGRIHIGSSRFGVSGAFRGGVSKFQINLYQQRQSVQTYNYSTTGPVSSSIEYPYYNCGPCRPCYPPCYQGPPPVPPSGYHRYGPSAQPTGPLPPGYQRYTPPVQPPAHYRSGYQRYTPPAQPPRHHRSGYQRYTPPAQPPRQLPSGYIRYVPPQSGVYIEIVR